MLFLEDVAFGYVFPVFEVGMNIVSVCCPFFLLLCGQLANASGFHFHVVMFLLAPTTRVQCP
jgi:hypothetical protein